MSKHHIIAKLYNRKRQPVNEIPLGTVLLDDGRMSADRYDRLKRQLFNTAQPAPKAHFWRIETTDGLVDTFGGYPALGFVRFAHPDGSPRDRGNASPIAAARMAAGLTQAQLAEKIGCTQKDISRWEHGVYTPSAAYAVSLANALGCSVEQLINA